MAKMNWFDWTSFWLVLAGALAWGVYGIGGFFGDRFLLIDAIVGTNWFSNVLYSLVGFFGLMGVITAIKLAMK